MAARFLKDLFKAKAPDGPLVFPEGAETPLDTGLSTADDDKHAPLDGGEYALNLAALPRSEHDKLREVGQEYPPGDIQDGVKVAEATTLSWSRSSLAAAYFLMFLIYFVNAMQDAITGTISGFIVSDFEDDSLIPVISVVSNVMAGACYMPIAKMLNMWERSWGFLTMATISTLGMILSASCNGITSYCAAQVFYTIGFSGMIFCVDVITLDTSTLSDRGLAYAFTSSPYIISAFAGPAAANHFYESNWRWGYGTFAIVLPVVALPLFFLLLLNKQKAEKSGLLIVNRVKRTPAELLKYIFHEFDLIGVFLLAGGFVIFLLPFTITGEYESGWASAEIISMLVVGGCMLLSFPVWEKYGARVPFLPWKLLTSRTVLGACLLDFFYCIAYYCWDDYLEQFLMVVNDVSITVAGDIGNVFDIVNGVWLIVVGLAIRRTGRFKWLLWWSVPLYALFEGLMIYFKRPNQNVGYLIMCQIFMAIGGGAIIICEQVAVLAAAHHNDAAAALALLNLFGTLGDSVGSAVSGAIWTNIFPNALVSYLPAESQDAWEDIYDSLDVQLSYPVGNATRTAIQEAYGETQTKMVIAGTAFIGVALVFVYMIKDLRLNNMQQVKGVLF